MNRKEFLTKVSAIAIAVPLLDLIGCSRKNELHGVFELEESTIDDLQEAMASGKYSSYRITEFYLQRIAELDHSGMQLNAVIELNPDALTIAKQYDNERQSGKVRGPLHGIPVLIKDNIETADKMQTTAGSLALEGNVAKEDAFLVKQLRNAGAVILGKTNLSEWANFRSTRSTSGWSSRGGQTKNPYVLSRNPCGSSSGSGTAVAANLCAVAIGTETNGSINCPASVNAIVGIKPTVGLVSRTGIIPISSTQDTAGPMARTVRDCAIVLNAIAGRDEKDTSTIMDGAKIENDYTNFLNKDGLRMKRIGVEKSYLKLHYEVDRLFSKALSQMKNAGAEIVEVDLLSELKNDAEEFEVLKFEFKDGLNKYLAKANGKVKTLEELIRFNKQDSVRMMPYFRQEILEASQALGDLSAPEYKAPLEKVKITAAIIDRILFDNKLDAICGPTNGPAWCTDLVNGDHFIGYGMYSPAAMAGYPSINVPMGMVQDLPVGLCFFSSAFQEGSLLTIAYAFEQISKNRIRPEFKLT